jgi:hypothetical protein
MSVAYTRIMLKIVKIRWIVMRLENNVGGSGNRYGEVVQLSYRKIMMKLYNWVIEKIYESFEENIQRMVGNDSGVLGEVLKRDRKVMEDRIFWDSCETGKLY